MTIVKLNGWKSDFFAISFELNNRKHKTKTGNF